MRPGTYQFPSAAEVEGEAEAEAQTVPTGADIGEVDPNSLVDINFDDGEFYCFIPFINLTGLPSR